MIRRIIVAGIVLLLVSMANSQELDWGKSVGSTGSDYATANCVDMFGNVYTVGSFTGTVDFDPGPGVRNLTATGGADAFIQKLDANGNFVFANYILPGTGTEIAKTVAVAPNGIIYVGGTFSGSVSGPLNATIYSKGLYDGFILSLTPTGSYTDIVPLGGTGNDYVNTISCNNGAVCAGGTFQGTVDFNPGSGVANLTATGTSGFLARYVSSNGNMTHSWSYVLGTAVNGSEMDASGNIWSTGSYIGTFDFNFAGGVNNLTSAGGSDVFIQKVSATGAYSFAKSYGGTGNDVGLGLAVDGTNNNEIYNSGYFNGTADFDPSANTFNLTSAGGNDAYVSKLTATGDLVWAKSFGSSGDDQALDVDFDQLYNVYSAGFFNNTVDFDPGAGTTNFTAIGGSDGFVSKLSSTGQFIWARTISGSASDYFTGINTSATDGIYLSGYYQGTIDIDPGAGVENLVSSGSNDAIVAKWRPCATMPSVTNTTPSSSLNICEGNSTTLTATGQGTISWYSAETGGTYLGSGASFNTGVLNMDTSFYVQDSTCMSSARTQVDVSVSPPAQNQTVSVANASLCAGQSTTVSIANSELNTVYYLRNDANNSIVDGPKNGTGSAINFTTGPVNSTTTFNVSAVKSPTNNALDLDGVNDYVNVGTSNRGIISAMTISARVRTTVNGASQFIVSKYVSASLGYYLVINSTGYASIQGRDVAGPIKSSGYSTTMVADTQWHEITGVVRSTGWEIWVDGVLENSGTYSLGTSGLGTTASMLVGSFGTTYSPLDIDRLAIWNTAISGSEIATLPSSCLTGGEANLVAYFPFSETSGTITADLSSSALDGTLVNMNVPACWLTGIASQCLGTCEVEMPNTVTVTALAAPAQPIITANGPTVICSGGSVTLTSSAGNSYLWSTGATTQSITVSTAGTYTVKVSNAANCQSVSSAGTVVTIGTSPAQPTISANGSTTFCSGGSVTLTSSAGTSYLWSNGATTQAINVTTSGTYTVRVTNASGCQSVPSAATTVTVNSNPTASISGPSTICNGASATLTASGGGTYAWSNSGGSNAQATFSPSNTTTYTVTVTSANNCTATASKTVTVNSSPTAGIQPATVTICSGTSATLTASGGGTYAWSNSGGSNAQATFSPSNTTTYTVTVTSANNYTATASKTVTVNSSPTAGIQPATVTICSGKSTTLTASGGGTYAWSNSGGSNAQATFSPSNTTTYTVTVTNANNCTATASKTVTVNSNPTATIQPASVTICSGTSATLTASGGGTYAWSNSGGSNAQATFSPSNTTTYTVTVTSANNCTATASKTVTVNSSPTAGIQPATVTICSGTSATLTASGGGTYAWSNSGGSNAQATFSPSNTTTYTVTVTSANNCTATASKTVTVNSSPTAGIQPATVTICSGKSTTLTASGGGTYAWSNSGGSNAQATFSPSNTTTYTVTVTNANNCTATASKTVTVNSNPTATIQPASITICSGTSATLTASGGGTYAWSNSGGSNAQATFSPSNTTTYTVTVTNANNCTATASKTVTVNQTPVASINGPTTICSGLNATLTASGGGTYAWSNSGGSNAQATFSPTATTTYTVTVTGAGNCTATASQTVSVQNSPTATITGANTVCAGGSVTLTANGGNTYAWANGLGSNAAITVSPAQTTTYTVTVSIGANCTATASKIVTVNQPTASTISQTICTGKTFTFNGQSLTQSGIYKDTLINTANCDSIITLNLTITPALQGSFSQTICTGKTFTFNGQQLVQSGTYKDTVQTSGGCDSIITLNLTVAPALQGSFSQTVCFDETFTFNGQQLAQSGTYKDTVQTSGGCDSIITLNLTVLNKIEETVNAQICTGQTYDFKGQQLSQAGQYFDTLQTSFGCDSFVTLNLTVNSFVTSSVSASICDGDSYTFNGQQLTVANQYLDTLVSSGGCDSIVTLTLTVNALPNPTITQNGNLLNTQTFNSYQWQLNGSDISNATTQDHTATQNGNYTVEVTDANGCVNTSSSVNVTGVGISEVLDLRFWIYPNPANEFLIINCDEQIESVKVFNVVGEQVLFVKGEIKTINVSPLAAGTYLLHATTAKGGFRKTFIKE